MNTALLVVPTLYKKLLQAGSLSECFGLLFEHSLPMLAGDDRSCSPKHLEGPCVRESFSRDSVDFSEDNTPTLSRMGMKGVIFIMNRPQAVSLRHALPFLTSSPLHTAAARRGQGTLKIFTRGFTCCC